MSLPARPYGIEEVERLLADDKRVAERRREGPGPTADVFCNDPSCGEHSCDCTHAACPCWPLVPYARP